MDDHNTPIDGSSLSLEQCARCGRPYSVYHTRNFNIEPRDCDLCEIKKIDESIEGCFGNLAEKKKIEILRTWCPIASFDVDELLDLAQFILLHQHPDNRVNLIAYEVDLALVLYRSKEEADIRDLKKAIEKRMRS